jgi:enoyl-CoA hydratase
MSGLHDESAGVQEAAVAYTGPDDQGISRLALNRPRKANSINDEMARSLVAALRTAYTDGTRALVVEGRGKNFCGGFDFAGYESASEGDLLLRFVHIEQALQLVRNAPFLTIAMVQGSAFGAGADLVAACAIRAGDQAARFRFPGLQFGLVLGTRHLTFVVGQDAARRILLTGTVVGSVEAVQIGLLTTVVEASDRKAFVAATVTDNLRLSERALESALRGTGRDTGDADMADLVRSASLTGLHSRISAYLQAAS